MAIEDILRGAAVGARVGTGFAPGIGTGIGALAGGLGMGLVSRATGEYGDLEKKRLCLQGCPTYSKRCLDDGCTLGLFCICLFTYKTVELFFFPPLFLKLCRQVILPDLVHNVSFCLGLDLLRPGVGACTNIKGCTLSRTALL